MEPSGRSVGHWGCCPQVEIKVLLKDPSIILGEMVVTKGENLDLPLSSSFLSGGVIFTQIVCS
jgi:hypothetical protein